MVCEWLELIDGLEDILCEESASANHRLEQDNFWSGDSKLRVKHG